MYIILIFCNDLQPNATNGLMKEETIVAFILKFMARADDTVLHAKSSCRNIAERIDGEFSNQNAMNNSGEIRKFVNINMLLRYFRKTQVEFHIKLFVEF